MLKDRVIVITGASSGIVKKLEFQQLNKGKGRSSGKKRRAGYKNSREH